MKNLQTTLQNWGEKIIEALKAAIPPQKDVQGILKESISFSIDYAGYPIVFELQLADFYRYIDEGRKPGHFPPPDAIKAWIINKQLNLKPLPTLKHISNKPKTLHSQQNALNQLSFLIGRKIAKDGIAPTNFYTNTITPDILDELQNNLSIAFKQDVIVMLSGL